MRSGGPRSASLQEMENRARVGTLTKVVVVVLAVLPHLSPTTAAVIRRILRKAAG